MWSLCSTYPPWGRVPVGVIVPLLGALVATPRSRIVLSCVDGCPPLQVPVGGEESPVALPQSAVEVVVVVLVHTILEVGVAVAIVTLVLVLWDGAVCVCVCVCVCGLRREDRGL